MNSVEHKLCYITQLKHIFFYTKVPQFFYTKVPIIIQQESIICFRID